MCSNTSSSGGCGGAGAGAGGENDYSSHGLRKQKRQRVPKRGPGVAELEKILRDQEKKDDDLDKTNIEKFPSRLVSPLLSTSCHPQSPILSSSNSFPRNFSFVPDHNFFSTNSLSGGGNGVNGSCTNGVHTGGSVMVLSEQGLLPTMWSTSEESVNGECPRLASGFPYSTKLVNGSNQMYSSPALLHRKHCQYSSPSVTNMFPHSALSSLSTPSSTGLHYQLEPPSNQIFHHNYISVWPEEEKMVGTKRSFSLENPLAPPFHHHVPPFSHKHILEPSSSCDNHFTFNLEPSYKISRDGKLNVPLELNSKKCATDYGAPDGSFLIFGSPTTPSPLTQTRPQEFSKLNSFPFQGSIEESHQKSGSSGSVHEKPYYSFLSSKEPVDRTETALSLNNEMAEARGDDIDLNLKL